MPGESRKLSYNNNDDPNDGSLNFLLSFFASAMNRSARHDQLRTMINR